MHVLRACVCVCVCACVCKCVCALMCACGSNVSLVSATPTRSHTPLNYPYIHRVEE
jgi:hypothetical protein